VGVVAITDKFAEEDSTVRAGWDEILSARGRRVVEAGLRYAARAATG